MWRSTIDPVPRTKVSEPVVTPPKASEPKSKAPPKGTHPIAAMYRYVSWDEAEELIDQIEEFTKDAKESSESDNLLMCYNYAADVQSWVLNEAVLDAAHLLGEVAKNRLERIWASEALR